jgi:hypothetical protein
MENTNISSEDVLQNIGKLFQNADAQRAAELTNAKTLININNNSLTAEQARLSAKYGKDDPRVAKLAAQVSNQQNMSPGLDAEITRSNLTSTGFNSTTSCLIQGTVYDATRTPMKNVTVYIADQNGRLAGQNLSTCSDANGSYAITLNKDSVELVNKDGAVLAASNKKQEVIYQDTTALNVAVGKSYLRDIYIAGSPCTPPPAGRDVNDAGKDVNDAGKKD